VLQVKARDETDVVMVVIEASVAGEGTRWDSDDVVRECKTAPLTLRCPASGRSSSRLGTVPLPTSRVAVAVVVLVVMVVLAVQRVGWSKLTSVLVRSKKIKIGERREINQQFFHFENQRKRKRKRSSVWHSTTKPMHQ
jgi:hypothetical protein